MCLPNQAIEGRSGNLPAEPSSMENTDTSG
jgi:hypothetical protein